MGGSSAGRWIAAALVALAGFLPAVPAGAQQHGAHGATEVAEADPPQLRDDLGTWHRAIPTDSPQAQAYFDQGLRLAYAFNHEEAARSFAEAARLDPSCASCWWGLAVVQGANINQPADAARNAAAREALVRAQRLVADATPVERELIFALGERYGPKGSDQAALDRNYARAMADVAKRHPDDPDVQAFYAESLMVLTPWRYWTPEGEPGENTREIRRVLESTLEKFPEHPGANHYYVHLMESSPEPGLATASADRLVDMMPGAGHIVHMPSHIYVRTGRLQEAEAANIRAIAADERWARTAGPPGQYAMYMHHNHDFLSFVAMLQGKSEESLEAARHASDLPTDFLRQAPELQLVLVRPLSVMVRFARWDQILAEPAPPKGFDYATALWHHARGRAFAAKGAIPEAERERSQLQRIREHVPADERVMNNRVGPLLDLADLDLAAAIAEAKGDAEGAVALLRNAVAMEDRLVYDEPPDWSHPVRPSLGAALLAADRPEEAEAVFAEDLARYPDNGWSLFGLAESLQAQGREDEAAEARASFERAWGRADVPLARSML